MDRSNSPLNTNQNQEKARNPNSNEEIFFDTNTNIVQDIAQNEMETDDQIEGEWIKVASRIRRYKAVINVKNLQGNTVQKIKTVNQAVGNVEDFYGSKLHFYGKEQFIMAEFGNKEKMLEACQMQIEENNDFRLEPIMNKGDEEIRNKTMVIRDLPLNVDRFLLKQLLEKRTEVKVTDIRTRIKGPWMIAHVIFEDEAAIKTLENVWSINYLKDLCRIAPANVTKEEIENRNKFTAKLANLPFGITAVDLKELLLKVNAKTCFIPRTRDKYSRLRYAYITFANETDYNNATSGNDIFDIKGYQLQWATPEVKACHKCGSLDHIVKDCEERERGFVRRQRIAQYNKIYTRYRVPNYRRYANYNTPRRYDYEGNNNFENNQPTTPNEVNFDKESLAIYELLKEVKTELNEMRQEMGEIKNRINKLEGKDPVQTKTVTFDTTTKGKQVSLEGEKIILKNQQVSTQGPVNNQGFIKNSEQNKNTQYNKNFNQLFNVNDNGKRWASNSGASSSTGKNQHIAKKQELDNRNNKDQPKEKSNEKDEIMDLRKMLNDKDSKLEGLTTKIDNFMSMFSASAGNKQFKQ
jgi:hypothetical protein